VNALASLISELKDVCAGLPAQRKGQRRDGEYSMADIGLSAFSVFFMGGPSSRTSGRWRKDKAGPTVRPCSA
jgi:hypothetical protein